MTSLRIDAQRTISGISDYLKQVIERDGTKGVMLGLSGGLDSCVLAALAVRALGREAIHVVYLSDEDSDEEIAENARRVAAQLGLELENMDISGEMRKRGVYKPLFIKALRLSSLVARVSSGTYELICRETPFKSTLRVGGGEVLRPWYKRLMFNMTMHHVDVGFAERHQFRRDVLENMARDRGLSLIGAANMSEFEVGWFVKDGIDDLPVQPMTGLFKTQVRQLAEALDLPETVRKQLPSPDMAKGVTDEFGIGHDYSLVDTVIDGIDRGLSDDDIVALGVSRREVADIRDLMRLSHWKRQSEHEAPPVSGKFDAGLRI